MKKGEDKDIRDENLHQMSVRLHNSDYIVMKKLLSDEGLKWSHFITYCVQSYINGDPAMMRIIKLYKELDTIPKGDKSKYTLSARERAALLDEIDLMKKEGA
ncbi:MAG: hypothetical protein WC895_05175 [Candidatus Shapirobacteria bacterium]|jgi:hypothetical protein